jgi:hypothetical protein
MRAHGMAHEGPAQIADGLRTPRSGWIVMMESLSTMRGSGKSLIIHEVSLLVGGLMIGRKSARRRRRLRRAHVRSI